MARGGEGMGEPHARGIPWQFCHAAGQPRPVQTGGRSKVQSRTWRRTTAPLIGRFFLASPHFRTAGRRIADRRAERGQPDGWGFRPAKRCAASPPRPRQPDPGAIANRVCHHAERADFRRIFFPFSGRLSGSDDLQGNNGNMGTSYVRQAESRASGDGERVPKPTGGFGNMGTEMADPDAGKSARVWLPPAPSSR